MNTYKNLELIINHANEQYKNGSTTEEEYELWKQNTRNKLDVFFACNRLTQAQYEELAGMFISVGEESK